MRRLLLLLLPLIALTARADDLEFGLVASNTTRDGARLIVPIELTISIDQLRFIDDGNQQVARITIRAGEHEAEHHVTTPRNVTPYGTGRYQFDAIAQRDATKLRVEVIDENAKRTGSRTITIERSRAIVDPIDEATAADRTWRNLLTRANSEKKPILIFFRTLGCGRCSSVENVALRHPTVERRLPSVLFATLPAHAGEAAKQWSSTEPGLAFFDRSGALRVRWPIVPDTMNLNIVLDSVTAVAPMFERALQLAEAGDAKASDIEIARALTRMGRVTDAQAALARAGVDAATLIEAKPETSEPHRGPIRILPLARQVVSGRQLVRTHVGSAAIARVDFSVDGRTMKSVKRPPFSATIDFGVVPERRAVRAVAFNRHGKEVGRDERMLNDGGETFWLRLTSPREGSAAGRTHVALNLRVPSARRVQRVSLSWNDAERAALTAGPWEAAIDIPRDQIGILRALAELDDGRTAEDAVLLNAGGVVGQSNVQLVEVPVTGLTNLRPDAIRVRDGSTMRRVESIATAAETPLTVGLLIDISDSMQATLPDVQEAAIRFLDTMLGPRDRAFLVAFDTRAHLVQPATSDRELLRKQILSMRPNGFTALHDAIVLGLLQFEGIKGRRALIVFSDGLDLTSAYRAYDVRDLAKRVNVPIHIIASTPGVAASLDDAPASAPQSPDNELANIARATGGTAHTLTHLAQLRTVYSTIEAALRAQILLFFRTDPATRENEWRRIKVEAGPRSGELRAPEGYYATW